MTRRTSVGAALLLGLAAAAGTARLALAEPAEPAGAFRSPAAGERLTAGASVRVLWERPAELTGEAREVELLLSIDGGRTFPIRLTPDLAPQSGALFWRVPAMPTHAARLALRAGEDQEPAEERIEVVSGIFEIAEDDGGGQAPESLRFVRGEWRTLAALGAAELPDGADLGPDAPGELHALAVVEAAGDAPRAFSFERFPAPSLNRAPDAPPAPPRTAPSARLRPSFTPRP